MQDKEKQHFDAASAAAAAWDTQIQFEDFQWTFSFIAKEVPRSRKNGIYLSGVIGCNEQFAGMQEFSHR